MSILPARILLKRGLASQLVPGSLLFGEPAIILDVGDGALAYGAAGGAVKYIVGPDMAAIEALTGTGFARRVAANNWVTTVPAPGDLSQSGAVTGNTIVWNGTVWAPANVDYGDIDNVPDLGDYVTLVVDDEEISGRKRFTGTSGAALFGDVSAATPNGEVTIVSWSDSNATIASVYRNDLTPAANLSLDASGDTELALYDNAGTLTLTLRAGEDLGAIEFGSDAASIHYDQTAEVLHVENTEGTDTIFSSPANTLLIVRSDNADGEPKWSLQQGTTERASMQWIDSTANVNAVTASHWMFTFSGSATLTVNTTTTTTTTLGQKDARVILTCASSTVNGGGEIVFGATGDTDTGRYFALGADIQANSSGAATGFAYMAGKAATSDTALTRYMRWHSDGRSQVRTGTSTTWASIGGTIDVQAADVGNVGAGEDDLHTFTVPASSLGTNEEGLEAVYAFTTAAHASDTRRIRAYFGGTLIYDSGSSTTTSADQGEIRVTITRESSTVVRCSVCMVNNIGTFVFHAYTRVTGLTLSNANILKITGEAVSDNDIIAKLSAVRWHSAA